MKLIDRFVGRELLVNVLFAIAMLSLVLVVGNIFRKLLPLLVNHDVPLEYLFSFIAYVLPFSLIFTIRMRIPTTFWSHRRGESAQLAPRSMICFVDLWSPCV